MKNRIVVEEIVLVPYYPNYKIALKYSSTRIYC